MRPTTSILTRICMGCFAFYGMTGCNDRAATDPVGTGRDQIQSADNGSAEQSEPAVRETRSSDRKTGVQPGKLLEETWFAISIDGKKVGHRRKIRRLIQHGAKAIVETAGREHIEIVREGREAVVDFDCIARETESGTFLGAEYRLPFGLNQGWTLATVDGHELRVGPKSGSGPAVVVPWPPDAGGPFAVDKSLRDLPMAPGKTRTLRYFEASLGQVITTLLKAADWETTDLLGGERRLLKIDVQIHLPNGAKLTSELWADDQGVVWKESQIVGVKVVAYRTSKETALSPEEGPSLDLFERVLVPIDRPISWPSDHNQTTYEIAVPDGDPLEVFVQDSRQRVRVLGPHKIQLVVDLDPVSGKDSSSNPLDAVPGPREPEEADLERSPIVQCDNPDIVMLASSVAQGATNSKKTAIALEKLVYETVEEKSYGSVFASAVEVAASREGDCTEHSVLLVALCRARGIPARAAMGLVYSDAHQAFAYHMWTEVWTGDSWLGLDATRGHGRIGLTHLKMSQSSLEGPAALAGMATILQAVEDLEIEVVEEWRQTIRRD